MAGMQSALLVEGPIAKGKGNGALMTAIKQTAAAFLVGGLIAVVGQVFLNLYTMVLGPGSMFISAATLVSVGLVGAVLFVLHLYPKIEKFGGFGAIMPFSGLAAAVGGTIVGAKQEGASTGKAIKAGVMLVVYVVGIGTVLSAIIGVIAFIVK